MASATIRLFLPRGDAKSLRTAEISNWSGKAIAAPRTELEELLAREELGKAGVYVLLGTDPQTNTPHAYIGEAEVIRDRIKQHKSKEFWVSVIVITSNDENLTKAHVRYLEARLLDEAGQVKRFTLDQNSATGSKLPESDRGDMEVFLTRIRQLLPVLWTDILTPVGVSPARNAPVDVFYCQIKGLTAKGRRSANGFVVFKGSMAVLKERPSVESAPYTSMISLWKSFHHIAQIGKSIKNRGLRYARVGTIIQDHEFVPINAVLVSDTSRLVQNRP